MAKIISRSGVGASGATGGGGGGSTGALLLAPIGDTATVGIAYAASLIATGGVPPYTYSISAGSLPSGLSLNTSTGAITGTPTTPGVSSFTGHVTDNVGTTAAVACSITVPNSDGGEFIGVAVSVVGAEVPNSVYDDVNDGQHMVVSATCVLTAVAFPIRIRPWLDYDDGNGWTLQPDQFAANANPVLLFGSPTQQTGITIPGTIWVPTDPNKVNWKVAVEVNSHAGQPSGAAVTNSFTVTPALSLSANELTGIQFVPNPDTGAVIVYAADATTNYWIWNELDWFQPSIGVGGNPSFKSAFATVQLGNVQTGVCTVTSGVNCQLLSSAALSTDVGDEIHVGGLLRTIFSFTDATHIVLSAAVPNGVGQSYEIFRPAPVDAINGIQGTDDTDAQLMGYRGRRFTDGPPASLDGITQAQIMGNPTWTIPPALLENGSTNQYITFRHRVYGVSRLGENESGGVNVITLQAGWAGGGDHGDLVPTIQSAILDLRNAAGHSLGGAINKDGSGRLQVKTGRGQTVNGSNQLEAALAPGLVFDGSGNTQPNLGYTMSLNGSNQIVLSNLQAVSGLPSLPSASYPAGAVVLNTVDSKIYRNPTGFSWLVSAAPADLVAGAVASGVSIAAAQISAGTLNVGVTYAGQINVGQLNAGTINVSLTLTAVTINVVSGGVQIQLDGSNYVLITNSGSTIWSQHHYAFFRVQRSTDPSWYGQLGLADLQLSSSGGAALTELASTFFKMTALISFNPGAGSKEFWYDPADGNRVKFAP